MLLESLEIIQQKGVFLLNNSSTLTVLTLLLCILLFWRSVVFRKRATRQSILVKEQSEHLAVFQEKLALDDENKKREEHFQSNLKQAEIATELQKSRTSVVHQQNSQHLPERYKYAKSMLQSGMATEEISSALGMSTIEVTQLFKLSSLQTNTEQFMNDKNILSLA